MQINTPTFRITLLRTLVLSSVLALVFGLQTAHAAIATDFTIINHKTGQPLSLHDYQGSIIVLDFWAYWCGPCQSASADIEPNVVQYYRNAGGNQHGLPVTVISISIDMTDPVSENAYIQQFGLELVGDDTLGAAFSQFDQGYIPQLVVINGTTNAVNHAPWEILFSQYGYTANSTVPAIKSVIDGVQPSTPIFRTITVLASPGNGGTVSGGGTYPVGSQVQISATPTNGWGFAGWSDGNTQNPRTIAIRGDATYTANFRQTGSLQVTISPTDAIAAGAQWQVDGGAWQNSGTTVSGLLTGDHLVAFKSAGQWLAPANQTVTIVTSQTTTATGTFIDGTPRGSLQVGISPSAAADAGAQWQVDGGAWQDSGATVSGLSAITSHTIAFNTVSGWTTPASQAVSIVAGQTTVRVGVYTAIPLPPGSLQVTLTPDGAISAGAHWRVDGGAWQDSGAIVSGLFAGTHAVAFQTIAGWTAPAGQSVTVAANQTATAAGVYELAYVPMKANYTGLFSDTNETGLASSGLFKVTTTKKGTFTAKFQLAGRSYSYSGQFSSSGVASNFLAKAKPIPVTVLLQVDLSGGDVLTGQINGGAWTAELAGNRAVFNSRTNSAPQAGKYTLVIPGVDDSSTQPCGDGYATLKVDGSGNITLIGTLTDGTKVSQTTFVSGRGQWPLFASLYSGNGSILGWLTFSNETDDSIQGPVSWIKLQKAGAKFYSAGFTNQVDGVGSTYCFTNGVPVLDFSTGQICLSYGNLPGSLTNQAVLGGVNKFIGTNKLSLTIASSGSFKGSMKNPANGKTLSFGGVVLQNNNIGCGCFLGTNQCGRVWFGSPTILSPATAGASAGMLGATLERHQFLMQPPALLLPPAACEPQP